MTSESTATPAQQIAAGYDTTGQALNLGSVVVDGVVDPAAQIRIPLSMMNRTAWWPAPPVPARPRHCR